MSWRDPNWRYTRVQDQGPNYLQQKFDRMRRESRCPGTTPVAKKDGSNVQPIKKDIA